MGARHGAGPAGCYPAASQLAGPGSWAVPGPLGLWKAVESAMWSRGPGTKDQSDQASPGEESLEAAATGACVTPA